MMENCRRSSRLMALEVEAETGRKVAVVPKNEDEVSNAAPVKRKRVKKEVGAYHGATAHRRMQKINKEGEGSSSGDRAISSLPVKDQSGDTFDFTLSDDKKGERKTVRKKIAKGERNPSQDDKKGERRAVRRKIAKQEPDPLAEPSNTEAEMHAFDGNEWWVGAHMSVAGGVENSVSNARLYGCQAWALFLRPKMQWECKPLSEENVRRFEERLGLFKYEAKRCLPHGSYLINLGNPDKDKRAKSLDAFLDELRRCSLLNIGLYNFHPGSGVGECSKEEACTNIAASINEAHARLSAEGLQCPIILLENMAGQGKQVGGRFEELGSVIEQVHDKAKIGVCLDTAHAFASGFDIRTREGFQAMMSDFDRLVGAKYLKGVHMNDSLSALSSKKDRHANIGNGEIGLPAFHCIMNDERFKGMPLVLETPAASWKVWQGEIQALYALQGLPPNLEAWTQIVEKLAALRRLEKEMEKSNSLAEGSKAAQRAAEGKPPLIKRERKTTRTKKVKGELQNTG